MAPKLDDLFHPRSIAVVGASTNPKKQGYSYVHHLLDFGFPGPVYPVNPRAKEVLGIPAYPSLAQVPGKVDYVISCVPSANILKLVEECAAKGVKVLHSFTARFGETGYQEDARLEQEMLHRAREAGLRIIGPNCMGLYYPKMGLAFKYNFPHEPGNVAFLSQSGGHGVEVVLLASARGVRFSKVISFGNALDLNEADFMEYLAEDPETEVIGTYLEGVREGRRFFQALRYAARRKPVILLKGGRTQAGTRAVASHTASLAGAREVWSAMGHQANAVMVKDLEEMADMLVAFRFLKPTTGIRVAVGGGGGGRAVQSSDDCEECGLQVLPLPPAVRERLKAIDPYIGEWVSNPADLSILGGSKLGLSAILGIMAEDEHYDGVIANVGESWLLDRPEARPATERMVDSFIKLARSTSKPVAVVLGDPAQPISWHRETIVELRERLVDAGMAVFPTVGRAARALKQVADYYRQRQEG